MATRIIATRLSIEGDAQYKQTMSQVNSELRVLDSSLKLVSSQYKENANSLEALSAKAKALEAVQKTQTEAVKVANDGYKNAQSAVEVYKKHKEDLTEKIEKNKQALEKLKQTQGDTTKEEQRLTEETAKLSNELNQTERELQDVEKDVNKWEISLNKAKTQLNNTNSEIRKNDQYLEEAKNSTDKCATSIDKFGKEVKDSGDSLKDLGSAFAAAGIAATLKKIADGFQACADASAEFESGMAGVAKTTDLTKIELEEMADAIQKLSTEIPQTTTELAKITETAGQLGIQNDVLLDFTRTMADLGVATNLSGEQAAQAFARFANITGMAQDDFDRLGSSVVELGNNLATTESEIADMSLRLAAAGAQAGMSQADIIGLAGALSAVGIRAEAGGSAFSKAINQMTVAVETGNEDLLDFARVSGMSADEFSRAFKEDAAGALLAFIQGLGNMEAHGKSAVVLLEELGLTEVRLRDSLTRAANAGDLFTSAIERSNRAWEQNTALSREAGLRYGTTESKLQMLQNSFNNVKIAVGDQLNPAVGKLADVFTKALGGVEAFIEDNEAVVPLVTGAAVAFGVLTAAVTGYTVVIPLAKKATDALTASLSANPYLLAGAAIIGLVVAIGTLAAAYDDGIVKAEEMTKGSTEAVKALDEVRETCDKSAASVEASALAAEHYVDMLEKLEAQGAMTNQQQREYEMIVGELNNLIPDLNAVIDKQSGLIVGGTEALRNNIAAWKDYAIQQGRMEALTEMYKNIGKAEVELAQNTITAKKAQAEYDEAAQKYDEANKRRAELIGEYGKKVAELKPEYQDASSAMQYYSGEMSKAEKQTKEANKAVEESTENLATLRGETEDYETALGSLGESVEQNVAGCEEMTDAQHEVSDSLQDVLADMDALKASYDEAYAVAKETIDGQVGLFDTFAYSATMSTDQMMEAWKKQSENIIAYSENLVFASQYLNDDLVAAWSDGTTESAGHIEAFNSKLRELIDKYGENSDEVQKFVDDFNSAYANTGAAKDTWAGNVAAMETDFQNSMDAIKGKMGEVTEAMDQSEDAAISANNTINGYIKTYEERLPEFEAIGKKMGDAVTKGYDRAAKINSPSKVAEQSAKYTVDGYMIPLEDGVQKLREIGEQMGGAVNQGYAEEIKTQMDMAAYEIYNASTTTNSSTVSNNSATINIYPQKIDDAEIDKLVGTISKIFGGKMTVNVARS